MKTILFIAGARPNFMKISALTQAAFKYRDKLQIGIIHTGQHYDDELSRIFFDEFKMPRPLANLNVGSGSKKEQLNKIIKILPLYLQKIKPDIVVIVGDVNSTIASAISAVSENIPVAHVEAGLRSFNWRMPEEVNRVAVDHMSDILFATEKSAVLNLKNEGIEDERIFFSGNVMIDTLMRFSDLAEKSDVLDRFGLASGGYALLTMHRQENVDDTERFVEILSALEAIDKKIPIICPLHPRTKKALEKIGANPSFKILPAQSYFDFLKLQKNAKFIITDSGGIQEEASILNVPCITIRTETERPITCELGTNKVAGVKKEGILKAAEKIMSGELLDCKCQIPLWDGKAGERIMKEIVKWLS